MSMYIVPLVNVVFLLLFISVIMYFISINPGSLVKKGSPDHALSDPAALVILPGKMMLDGKPAEKQALSAIPPKKQIIVTISSEIPYLHVAEILDLLRASGHTHISLTTKSIHN